MALPNLGGLRLGPAAGGADGAEATAGFLDDYEVADDDYDRLWDRVALRRVATPSANHEHWYEGHPGHPKSGLTVATVRYFGPHTTDYHQHHHDHRDAAKIVSAELIVHGWHMKAEPPLSAGHANPALAWLVELERVSARALAADSRASVRPYYQRDNRDSRYRIDSAHRTPGCDADDGECAVPEYELLDHGIHEQLVEFLKPEDPEDVRVRSMQVGKYAQFGYLLQMEVPEALASSVNSKTDGDPVVVFEPMVRFALATILARMSLPADYARELFFRSNPPTQTTRRTADYLDDRVGPKNYLVHEYGLLTARSGPDFTAQRIALMEGELPWNRLAMFENANETPAAFVNKVFTMPRSSRP